MLQELVVENLGVIERAELDLVPGSNVLTGETGAGKTLVVSALSLLLGARGDRSLIRHGAEQARIEARFRLREGHPALAGLRAAEFLGAEEREVVIARTISDGGGKARINGRLATVSALAELAPALVEIAGQHEHQRITSPRDQLSLLDAYAGPDALGLAEEVAAAVRAAAAALRSAEQLEASERERERELDVLRFEIDEIQRAELREGERAELLAAAERAENAEAIAAGRQAARAEIDDETGAAAAARRAAAELARVAELDADLATLADRLGSAAVELEDVALELARAASVSDPVDPAAARDRISAIDKLRRKYGDDEREILAYLDKASPRAAELEAAAEDAASSRAEATAQRERALKLAARLSEIRRASAPRLAAAVEEILSSLAMASSKLEVALEPVDLHEGGIDRAQVRIGSGGHPPRPLRKVASGGELSRLALALRLATGNPVGSPTTVVFDEVDAGVGGEAARAVGRCLAELARANGRQVIVVTHLPQVAAFAEGHLRVARSAGSDGSVSATVERLGSATRVEELSRMLAGLPDSDTAREHAQELLDIAASG